MNKYEIYFFHDSRILFLSSFEKALFTGFFSERFTILYSKRWYFLPNVRRNFKVERLKFSGSKADSQPLNCKYNLEDNSRHERLIIEDIFSEIGRHSASCVLKK